MSQKTEDSSAWGGVMTPAETVTDVSEADEKTYGMPSPVCEYSVPFPGSTFISM